MGVLGRRCKASLPPAAFELPRLVNDRLATVQADACSQIIEVSSSKHGRAWAFRGGKGDDEACKANRGVSGGNAAGGGVGSDSLARRCFMQAWRLDTF